MFLLMNEKVENKPKIFNCFSDIKNCIPIGIYLLNIKSLVVASYNIMCPTYQSLKCGCFYIKRG